MSKAKRIPSTIFDDHLAKKIKGSIESYLVEMWKFVYSDNLLDTHENNQKDKNRSSTKTDDLHRKFAEIFIECFGNYKDDFNNNFQFKVETDGQGTKKKTKRLKSEQKDLYGKYFNIDIELNNIILNETFATVLLKAPMTSISKNRFNLIDNMLGESLRVLTKQNLQTVDNSILFVTVVPNETFTVNKKRNNLKLEYSNHIALYSSSDGQNTIVDESALSDKAKDKIKEIVISYDFNFKGKEFNTLQELKTEISTNNDFIIVDDLTIQYFRHYIHDFLEINKNIPEFFELLEYVNNSGVSKDKPITLIDDPTTKPERRTGKRKI